MKGLRKMTKRYLFSRKHAGEEYKFFLNYISFSWADGSAYHYISVDTPENGLGCTDTVLLDSSSGRAYTLWRYLPPYILRNLEKQMKAALRKYVPDEYAEKALEWQRHAEFERRCYA